MKNILVYQIGSLGDTLVAVPGYRAIRNHFGKDAKISVIYNLPSDSRAMPQQILAGSGLVDDYIGFKQTNGRSSIGDSLELWSKLLPLKADVAVYLAPAERSPQAVKRDILFFKLAGAKRLIGFHSYDPKMFAPRDSNGKRTVVPHEASLRLDRLERDGIKGWLDSDSARLPLPAEVVASVKKQLDSLRNWHERPLIAIGPGANQPAKYWPFDRMAEIGTRLIETNQFEIVVIGGPRERETANKLIDNWGEGINLAGNFTVTESAALISMCQFLLGLDTGTSHLAAAVGTPVVGLYADRDPAGQWLPIGDYHHIIRKDVPCGGCGLKVCNISGHPCMTQITVDEVWEVIERLLQKPKSNNALLETAPH